MVDLRRCALQSRLPANVDQHVEIVRRWMASLELHIGAQD